MFHVMQVEKSMPDFYKAMKNQMRSEEQGADTIIWLSVSKEATAYRSGEFFFDRTVAPKHLWLSGTRYKADKPALLAAKLERMLNDKGFALAD